MFLRMCSLCSLLNLGSGTRGLMSGFSLSSVFLVKNCFHQNDGDDVQGYCKSVLDWFQSIANFSPKSNNLIIVSTLLESQKGRLLLNLVRAEKATMKWKPSTWFRKISF